MRRPRRRRGFDSLRGKLFSMIVVPFFIIKIGGNMPHNKLNISGAQADVLSWVSHGLTLEEENMLRNVSRLPCLFKHVALMPDAHLGKGSMVGSVIATKDAVIPATVGVDIGCGMMAVKTPFKSGILDRKTAEFRHEVARAIPVGFSSYKEWVDEAPN